MNYKSNQKIILISLFAVFTICACSGFTFAERGLEIDYPNAPGAEAPAEGTELPGYIKYIFNFSVMIGGILAFAVLLFGGIRWMASVGNPAAISDARSWMLGGIMGLVLLLGSYLILTTINPDLAFIQKMEPLDPVAGICLCEQDICELPCVGEKQGEQKQHFVTDAGSIDTDKFQANSMFFISSPDELTSVFIFKNENYKADFFTEIERIKNKDGSISFDEDKDFAPKSIYFLRNKQGVYLYEGTDYCESDLDNPDTSEYLCATPPKYLSGSVEKLGKWENRADSLKFNPENTYGAVLFTNDKHRGKCGYAFHLSIPDLSRDICSTEWPDWCGYYIPENGIGNNTLSSLALINIWGETYDDVVFWDGLNCSGNGKKIDLTGHQGAMILKNLGTNKGCPNTPCDCPPNFPCCSLCNYSPSYTSDCCLRVEPTGESPGPKIDSSLHRNILSFDINGSYAVVLNTGQHFKGNDCQLFLKPEGPDNCYHSIKNDSIYSSWAFPGFDPKRVESIIIIPTPF